MACQRILTVARVLCVAVLRIGLLGGLGFVPGHAAMAGFAPDSLKTPMQVMLVRSSDPGCAGHCSDWIAMQGPIGRGSFAAVSKLLQGIGDRKLPILISSPGGSVEEAIAIGRLIHGRHLDVAVTRTVLASCPGDRAACGTLTRDGVQMGEPIADRAFCASACPLILAAGTRRFAAPWVAVGLHQFTGFRTQTRVMRTFRILTQEVNGVKVVVSRTLIGVRPLGKTTSQVSPDYSRAKAYLAEVGVSAEVLTLLERTPPSEMYWLTRADLAKTRLDTEGQDGQYLVFHAADDAALARTPPVQGPATVAHVAAAAMERAVLVAPRSLGSEHPIAGTVVWSAAATEGGGRAPGSTLSAQVDLPREGNLSLRIERSIGESGHPQLHVVVALRPEPNGFITAVRAIGSPELRMQSASKSTSLDGTVTVSTVDRLEMVIPAKDEADAERLLSEALWFDIPILVGTAETLSVSFVRGKSGDQAMQAWRASGETKAAGRNPGHLIVGVHENPVRP